MQEGIRWTPIQYFNNKIVCDLIENKLVRVGPALGGSHWESWEGVRAPIGPMRLEHS